ncbi:hypothetical protein HYX15_03510 [Candidatus Woesearchaeota archaeon]|nr:hypothetical protein [Candidatus Woesearchaeota archaeon]
MKIEVILLLIILSTLAIAQQEIELVPSEERLEINYHSFGGQYKVDLRKYLGDGPYKVEEPNNVIIEINQETGEAIITPKPGFEGSEIIRFQLERAEATISLPRETFRELNVGRLELFQDAFNSVITNIKKEDIKKITSGFVGNKIIINIDDEVKLSAGYDESLKPEFTFDLLLQNRGVEVQRKIFETKDIILIIGLVVLLIVLYVFRDKIITIIRPKEDPEKIKKLFLYRISKYKEDDEKIVELAEAFFDRFLNVKKDSNLYILDLALEKRQIRGDLKQQIIDLFKHINKEKHDKKDIEHIYNNLRKVLVKL